MNETLVQPLQNALSTFLSFLPQLVGAIIILIVGYIIAKVLQAIVGRVLQGVGFDGWMERGGIKQFFDRAQTNYTPATVIGSLVFWFVFIIALTMAADALGIPQVSEVLGQLIAFIPNIIAAILILILAALLANFVSGIVRGATGSGLLASVARYAIIVYAVFAALTQLDIAVELTAPTFLILLGAVALAAALAFGIGGRDLARDILQKAYNRSDEVTPRSSTGGDDRTSTGGDDRTTFTPDR
ncbi:MAG: mechanosensitive ion channel [Actinobacteria bacterium]|nr:mechanosensitive ion channel [Actinomycetota bacterium]